VKIEDSGPLAAGMKVVSPHTTPPYRPLVVHVVQRNEKRTRCIVTVRLGEGFRTFPIEMIDYPPLGTRWNPDLLAWCDSLGVPLLPLGMPK
jgi:hypothetical protein